MKQTLLTFLLTVFTFVLISAPVKAHAEALVVVQEHEHGDKQWHEREHRRELDRHEREHRHWGWHKHHDVKHHEDRHEHHPD
jgi:hypothetical protein